MTKQKAEKNLVGNTIGDRIMQGIALFVLIGLAYWKVFDYVKAYDQNMRLGLAALPIAGVLYLIIAPFFRNSK